MPPKRRTRCRQTRYPDPSPRLSAKPGQVHFGYGDGEAVAGPDFQGWLDARITPGELLAELPELLAKAGRDRLLGIQAIGRRALQDFVYLPDENAYRCPAKEKLIHRYATDEKGLKLHRYWTNACGQCPLKAKCTTGKERRITRWDHEDVVEAVQKRLDANPDAMRTRRETVEHPFGTIKMRMGATHFLCKTLPKVATEMALCVLAYNLTRVMNIAGVDTLLEALKG
jgi:Transposase DDE domain